jgi:tRNA1Val (adenine37-N6)-methyltransferase
MSVFRFKHFEVRNELSAMKVNTDGVLLGAVTEVFPQDRNVLDVGTGTGTVALMIAQRLQAVAENGAWHVLGIDIDAPSATEASCNFQHSPWSAHLVAQRTGLQSFASNAQLPEDGYDLIVSNPPYYDNSLKSPESRRNSARHTGDPEDPAGTEVLSYREILEYSSEALSARGRISVILPSDQEKPLLRYAGMCGFVPWKMLRIKSVDRKPVSRLIVQLIRKGCSAGFPVEESLTLLDEKGKRTSQHASLVTDYYL